MVLEKISDANESLNKSATMNLSKITVNEADLVPEESRVGKKLNELTQRRVIILVLVMLFSIPLFSTTTYFQEPDSFSFGLHLLTRFEANSVSFKEAFESFVQTHADQQSPLILVSAASVFWESGLNPDKLRTSEKELVSYSPENTEETFVAFFDLRKSTKLQAALSIVVTFVVCIILASGSMILNKITSDLVITPIENMIEKVRRISENPLKAA